MSPAQNTSVAPEKIDLLPYAGVFENVVRPSSVEAKRTALLELRNFRTAEASRIAAPALRDASEIVRATAAATVVFLPTDEALRNLLPLLADKKPFVRREAAAALGQVGDAGAVNPLLRLAQKDKIAEVRHAAIIALGEIGDLTAVGALTDFLRGAPTAKEEFRRRSAARSIGQIAQFTQTGKIVVRTPENFPLDRPQSIEQPKYPDLAVAFPPFQAAVNVLIQTLNNARELPDVKREAAFALGAIGDDAAIAVLQANAAAEDYYLAAICREALLKIAAASRSRAR